MMAGSDATRNVQVNLTANVDPFQRAMQDAGKAVNVLSVGIVSLGKKVDDLVKHAGKKIALVGVSDIAALTAAAEAANRLDTSMSAIRANSALTGQSVGKLRGEVMNLSRSIPDTTNNIAQLMGQLQSMGIAGTKNLSLLTKQAEQLAAATNTAPGQLMSGIISMNREMGSGLATVSNYSSALIELSKTMGVAPTQVMDFATSIQAVAQQAGYSQTQVMGLAAAFTRAGADSSAAATVFTTITSEINQAIVTGNAQLQQFGNLIGMTAQQFRSFAQQRPEQAFEKIIQAIGAQGKGGILTLQQMGLDGPRGYRAVAQMTSGQANISQAMNTASDAFARNTALSKSSAAAWNDLSADLQKMRNTLDEVVIRLGGPMLHVLDMMAKGVTAVIGPLATFMGYLGPIPGIVAGIGGAFMAVSGTILAFSIAVMAAAGAWRALSGMTGTNTMQGLVSGLRAPQGTPYQQAARTMFRQNPIDMTSRSGPANRIFAGAYGLGQRFSAPPPTDPNFAQRAMAATGRGAKSLLTFPFRKVGWEARETANTLVGYDPHRHAAGGNLFDFRAIGDYTRRNNDTVNPMSFQGMFLGGQRGVSAAHDFVSDQIIAARDAGQSMWQKVRGRFGGDAGYLKVKADTSSAEEAVARIKDTITSQTVMPVTIKTVGVRGASGMDLNLTTRTGGAVAGEEEMAQKILAGGRLQSVVGGGRTSSVLGLAGRGVGAAVGALGGMANAISSVIFPLSMMAAVATPLYVGLQKLKNSAVDAAQAQDDFGAGIVRNAGGVYNRPTYAPPAPADAANPFGTTEQNTAVSSGFSATAGGDIKALGYAGKSLTARRMAAQQIIQNIVRSNGGMPVNSSEQAGLREALIAAYGTSAAQQVYGQLNLKGTDPLSAATATGTQLRGVKNTISWWRHVIQGSSGDYTQGQAARQIQGLTQPTINALNAGDTTAGALALAGLTQPLNLPSARQIAAAGGRTHTPAEKEYGRRADVEKFQASVDDIVSGLNRGQKPADRIHINGPVYNLTDFLDALSKSGARGHEMAAQMQLAGLNANNLSASLATLNTAVENSTTVQQANLTINSRVGKLVSGMGFDPANPTNANYVSQMASATYGLEAQTKGRGSVPLMTDVTALTSARDAWEQYKATLSATSPALQGVQGQIDSLNSAIQTQNSLFQTPGQQASGLASLASNMINTLGTNGEAGQSEQTYLGMAQQQIGQAENQLKSYMTTVHEFHIQEKDAFYQRNQQIKQMNHEFAEQIRQMNFQVANVFGNPAQMVQSQFTMGADQGLIGMKRQVDMLRQSKSTMDQLHGMGLSRDAIRLLGLDDPKNVEQAQRYLGDFARNPKLVGEFNKSIKGRLKIANGINTDENNSKFADMKRQFDYTAAQAEKAFKHSQEQAMISINELGKTLFTSFADLNHQAMTSGLSNIQQYAAGIMGAIKDVGTATTDFLNSTNIGGNPGGGPTVGGRKWTGTPTGKFAGSGSLHRQGGQGVNSGMLLSNISNPGTDMKRFGNPDLHWGADVQVAPDNRTLSANAKLAQNLASTYGWNNGPQWAALYQIWQQESGFSTTAGNGSYYGIPQGPIKQLKGMNASEQIAWGLNYIMNRYGDPLGAWAHKSRTGWYAKGGVFGSRQVIGVGENGPEAVLPLNSIGASFVAQVIARTMPITKTQVAMTHTAPRASVIYNGNTSTHLDYSTAYTGDIHVEASDPAEMQRKLEARKRLQALRRPVAGR